MTSMIFIVLLATVIFGPPAYWWWRDNHSSEGKRKLIEREVLALGTPEQKSRWEKIKQRELDLKLRLIESEQAAEILSNNGVRKKLERADVDVDRLKALLMTDEEVTKLLEE